MSVFPPLPEHLAAKIGFLTDHERRRLWEAALLMADSHRLLVRLTGVFGRQVEVLWNATMQARKKLGGNAWIELTQKAHDAVEDVLWSSYSYATFGLEATPHFIRPKQPRKNVLHKLAVTTSGAASGFVGFPGAVVDIPFTTAVILRSIAEVARDSGEDLSSEDTRRTCLEVLALGGPSGCNNEPETAYWAARLGINHLTINLLIRNAARRFGLLLSEKLMVQAVPIAGAITGAVMNYSFADYYQSMAKVHFCLRSLERRTGDSKAVKFAFAEMVRAARERRRIRKRRHPLAPALLPER